MNRKVGLQLPVVRPRTTMFQYAVVGEGYSFDELRSLQDWHIRFELQSVSGVSEVASVGGFVRQYQVILDPARLLGFGVTAEAVVRAIRASNTDVGGRTIEVAGGDYMVRGLGYLRGVGDIADLAVGVGPRGTPVRVADVARVSIGPDMRLGFTEWNGRGEAVGGVVVMRYGENALEVIDAVKEKIEEIETGLPPGVCIVATYDRSDLIRRATTTLASTLIEESLVVALVCMVCSTRGPWLGAPKPANGPRTLCAPPTSVSSSRKGPAPRPPPPE